MPKAIKVLVVEASEDDAQLAMPRVPLAIE
jgi:hypothetical protein